MNLASRLEPSATGVTMEQRPSRWATSVILAAAGSPSKASRTPSCLCSGQTARSRAAGARRLRASRTPPRSPKPTRQFMALIDAPSRRRGASIEVKSGKQPAPISCRCWYEGEQSRPRFPWLWAAPVNFPLEPRRLVTACRQRTAAGTTLACMQNPGLQEPGATRPLERSARPPRSVGLRTDFRTWDIVAMRTAQYGQISIESPRAPLMLMRSPIARLVLTSSASLRIGTMTDRHRINQANLPRSCCADLPMRSGVRSADFLAAPRHRRGKSTCSEASFLMGSRSRRRRSWRAWAAPSAWAFNRKVRRRG